ncbi:FAD-dependent oxidoreductase [Nonomuraea sp. NPDC049309]|uniref:FAD-dependent oxidoreductase n=1 Tax=Nonomuraea sp. NPDC049309 TaxID=3364350 RepID=UPI0037174B88
MNATTYDVVVIGGGAAGLGGALALSRARRAVLVIDSGRPRNAPAEGVHVYLGREGTPPRELLAAGREEVARYGGRFATGTVTDAERLADGRFRLALDDGSAVEAARLLVATGAADELPPVPGLAGRWGKDVLHCPYCHGWEVRDQAIGVLGTSPLAVHQALLWRQWSADVTLFTHTMPEPDAEERERLDARGVTMVEGEVAGLIIEDGRLAGVRMADGREYHRRALTVASKVTANVGALARLGLETAEMEMSGHVVGTYVPVDAMGKTAVPGVWAAGNVTGPAEQVIGSAAAGVKAGAAINAELIEEETRALVAARRAAQGVTEAALTAEELWDARYVEKERIWSGEPNAVLVREVGDLPPGRALDLGSGEGGDAVWLAGRGWRVTAADVSGVALRRAAELAERAGVSDRIDWQRHDLGQSFPEGTYDLVTACYLHSPQDLPREKILRAAAAAVAPGGVLLVAGHAGWPSWEEHPHPEVHFPTTREVYEALEPAEDEWEILTEEEFDRPQPGPGGEHGTRRDNVLTLRRLRSTL